MPLHTDQIALIKTALEHAPNLGWNAQLIRHLKEKHGLVLVTTHIPGGLRNLSDLTACYFDDLMMQDIQNHAEFENLKIRDRITFGVRKRLEHLSPYKTALKKMLPYMGHPLRLPLTKKISWRTSDILWRAAGDTATDYNHYTKRILLTGVFARTTAFWLRDTSDDHEKTWTFLDQRIENTLKVGRGVGKTISRVLNKINGSAVK